MKIISSPTYFCETSRSYICFAERKIFKDNFFQRITLMVFRSIMSNFAFFWIALRMYWIANFTYRKKKVV